MRRKKTRTKSRSKLNALGLFQVLLFTTFFYLLNGVASSPLETQSVSAQTAGLPFRPIGSDSAVDRYSQPGRYTETGYREDTPVDAVAARGVELPPQSIEVRSSSHLSPQPAAPGSYAPVRRVSMQSGGFVAPPSLVTPPEMSSPATQPRSAFSSPPNQRAAPPSDSSPLAPPSLGLGNNAPPATNPPPRSLPSNVPGSVSGNAPRLPSYAAPPTADYAPIMAPQLSNGGFATMADCRLITPPSSYTAMSPYGDVCGNLAPIQYTSPYIPPPAQIAAPAVMPPMTISPPVITGPPPMMPMPGSVISPPSAAPIGSLVTFGQETQLVQVGQGLWGQPVAYVPGQRCRNWLRYLSF